MLNINPPNPFGLSGQHFRNPILLLVLGFLSLSGCGGGGGSDPEPDSRVELTGSILVPGGTSTTENSMGLQGLASRPISLFKIDDEGNIIGDVLDTGTSDSNGNYVLLLPENVPFSSDLIVEAQLDDNQTARAIVIDETTDITPITEYITAKLIENPDLDLSAMPLTEVTDLLEFVESLDLGPQPDMASALVEIASFSDLVVEAEIDDINSGQTQVRLSGLLSVPTTTSPRGVVFQKGNIQQRPIPNQLIELYRIDNDGNPIGSPIETTTTNAEGVFTMLLPDGEDLSSALVLQAVVNGEPVRAMVTNDQLNISAVSEYVYQQVTADPDLVVEELPVAEVYGIVEFVESLNIAESTSLTATLTDIDAEAGTEVDAQIATIQQTVIASNPGVFDSSLWGASSFQ